MEVEQPSAVLQRIKDDDPLQDLQVDEPPLKKVRTVQTPQPSPAPLGPPGDCQQTRHPLAASLLADKYLILEQIEGSSLYSCVDVRTQEDLVVKVRFNNSYCRLPTIIINHFS